MITRRTLFLGLAGLTFAAQRVLAQSENPTTAQPMLPTAKLVITTHDGRKLDFTVEMALTQAQQIIGLGGTAPAKRRQRDTCGQRKLSESQHELTPEKIELAIGSKAPAAA